MVIIMLDSRFLPKSLCALTRWVSMVVLCLVWLPASATSYFHNYGYSGPYYGYRPSLRYDAETARLRDALRAGRRHLREQQVQQATQLRILSNQVDATYRVSAGQACYYRLTGGYEACEDMFDSGSEKHTLCEEKVRHRNPGCS